MCSTNYSGIRWQGKGSTYFSLNYRESSRNNILDLTSHSLLILHKIYFLILHANCFQDCQTRLINNTNNNNNKNKNKK